MHIPTKKMKLFAASLVASLGLFVLSAAPASASTTWTWSGHVSMYDKSDWSVLDHHGDTYYADPYTTIKLKPEWINHKARHFTVIIKDMKSGKMVHYKTMVSPSEVRHDSHKFAKGDYWVQVNAYDYHGKGIGSYYSKLIVK